MTTNTQVLAKTSIDKTHAKLICESLGFQTKKLASHFQNIFFFQHIVLTSIEPEPEAQAVNSSSQEQP